MLFSDLTIERICIFCKEFWFFSFNNGVISAVSVFLMKQLAQCMNNSCRWYRVQCSIFLDKSLYVKFFLSLSLKQWNKLSYYINIDIDRKISMLSWFSTDVFLDQFQYPSTSNIWIWINKRNDRIVDVINQHNIFWPKFVDNYQSSWPK